MFVSGKIYLVELPVQMKLEEFQAKELLARYQIPVPPNGGVLTQGEDISNALRRCGPAPWVIKAQVQTGGRGKAGGILLVKTPAQAREAVQSLLGKKLVTAQTGAEGILVRRVLVEKTVEIKRELYTSIAIDRKKGMPILIAIAKGGVEVEELAQSSPESIAKLEIDPMSGLETYQARSLLFTLGLYSTDSKLNQERIQFFKNCAQAFLNLDCSLLEINPLAVTSEDQLIALDAKIILDDNALFRHPELKIMESGGSALEQQAKRAGISYIALKGNIGCLVNGAGLAMATMDLIKQCGGDPANFLDVGGGANLAQVTKAFKIILSDKNVKTILVNIFGGIMKCDLVAEGIIAAVKEVNLTVPLVVRLEGNRAEEGLRLLTQSRLNIVSIKELKDAAQKAVELACGVPTPTFS